MPEVQFNNIVIVERISSFVEGEILVSISGVNLLCFAGNLPQSVEVGNSYSVRLNLMLFYDYDLQERASHSETLERVDNSYAYSVTGVLSGSSICCQGFVLEDEILSDEYSYLDGKMVSITADRIDVAFL